MKLNKQKGIIQNSMLMVMAIVVIALSLTVGLTNRSQDTRSSARVDQGAGYPENGKCGGGSGDCLAGRFGALQPTAEYYRWQCVGISGGKTVTCTKKKTNVTPSVTVTLAVTPTPEVNPCGNLKIDGVCGEANGAIFENAQLQNSDKLCATGEYDWSDSLGIDGTLNWVCRGINGGKTSLKCSAVRRHPCVTNNNQRIISDQP